VTSLDLNSFLLAFSRFTNLRGGIEVSVGQCFDILPVAERLPSLLESTEFHNYHRKRNVNWVKIPPHAPSQGGSWESMVKLFKNALSRVVGEASHKPSLIELQTFVSDALLQ